MSRRGEQLRQDPQQSAPAWCTGGGPKPGEPQGELREPPEPTDHATVRGVEEYQGMREREKETTGITPYFP